MDGVHGVVIIFVWVVWVGVCVIAATEVIWWLEKASVSFQPFRKNRLLFKLAKLFVAALAASVAVEGVTNVTKIISVIAS